MTDPLEIYNIDGSLRDGSPAVRPDITPAEMEMDPVLRQFLVNSPQEDERAFNARKYDQIMPYKAAPGDEKSRTLWDRIVGAGQSFDAGLRRSKFNYMVAVIESVDAVAEKLGLDRPTKDNLLVAAKNKYKNMQMQPTSDEWQDQLFYLVGQIAPDAVGLALGGGVIGKGVGMGLKAANFSKRTASIGTLFGRIGGDTGINVLQFMAHEAGQAELEGREAEYGQAAQEALVMGAAMSTIARTSQIMGLKKRYTVPMMASIGAGLTGASMDDNDPAKQDAMIANGILFGLFGLAIPNSKRMGAQDIFTWVKAKRELKQAPDSLAGWTKDFFTEFIPETYHKTFVVDPKREKGIFDGAWGDPNYMSPKDDFLLLVSQVTNKELTGLSDNQLVHAVADMMDEIGLTEFSKVTQGKGRPNEVPSDPMARMSKFSGVDRATNVQNSKIILDAVNDADAIFMKDNPKYESLMQGAKATPVTYKDRILKIAKEKDQAEGYVAIDENGKKLRTHQVSLKEFQQLYGDDVKLKNAHRALIEESAKTYVENKPNTYPNKGGLIQHGLYKDYGHIHRKPKAFVKRPESIANIDKWADNTINTILENDKLLHNALKRIEAETEPTLLNQAYKMLVDGKGRLYDLLEKMPGGTALRNAVQLNYLTSGKIQLQMQEIIEKVGFTDMSPRYRALLTAHITQRAELDFIKRAGHETGPRGEELKAVPRERIQRGEDIRRELQELERKADREFAELDGFKGMQKKIDIIENKFAEMFDRAHEAGLFGPETYQILKDYKWVPQKTIDHATKKFQNYILDEGARKTKTSDVKETEFLHDLMADASKKDKVTNIEHLMQEWISKVETGIARNALWSEMATMSSPLWKFENPNKGASGIVPKHNFVEKRYMKEGNEESIWVEAKLADMIEKQQSRMMPASLSRILRAASGTQATQLSAVATNPFFAIFTHPLDLFHVMTHHQSLGKYVPDMFGEFYIYNKESGAFPFMENFKSAWKQDQKFKDYVMNDGTTNTIVSSIAAQEQMKRSTDYLNRGGWGDTYKKYYNGLIDKVGKFGHTMEVATRMTETQMLKNTGKYTDKEAAHESLRRLNYSRRGAFMEFFDTMIPFANAQAQILASNLSELKTVAGAKRAAVVMSQLALGIGMSRAFIEYHWPASETNGGIFKHIPWETRMRYPFMVPTGATEQDQIKGQEVRQLIKIKGAYNPVFSLANMALQLQLDRFYYGEDGMPPMDVVQMAWDALAVSSPVEFSNMIPPTLKVLDVFTGNVDMNGNKVYRGPVREHKDEINDYRTGGIPTTSLAIATGQVLDALGAPSAMTSPARIQAAADYFIAANPMTWLVGSFLWEHGGYPRETQNTMIQKASKQAGLRKFLTQTNPSWVEHESGTAAQKEAGSEVYYKYDKKIVDPLFKFHRGDINSNQFMDQVMDLIEDSKPEEQLKMKGLIKQEIGARALLEMWKEDHGLQAIHWNIPPLDWWTKLRNINDYEYRAKRFYEEYREVENTDWGERFLALAKKRGLFANKWFKQAFAELDKQERKQQ